jgi:hypothetical protein
VTVESLVEFKACPQLFWPIAGEEESGCCDFVTLCEFEFDSTHRCPGPGDSVTENSMHKALSGRLRTERIHTVV